MQRHEEKYLIDYRQYAILKSRALEALTPDAHGGSYTVTSLYFDDAMDTALLEKQDGLARHTKFRVRTYDGDDSIIKLERKVKQGILTQKQTATITREQIATVLHHYCKYKGIDVSVGEHTNILSYADAFDVSGWAMEAMQWACGSGAIEGIAKNDTMYLEPHGDAARSEGAVMLYRFCVEIMK